MAASVVYSNFGGQIVHENRGGVERQYVPDPLGSTIALTDSSTAVTDTWDYWPYGEVMARTGTNPTPFTFVGTLGYFKDLLDRLLYVRARHYQPSHGRWLTVDPLWPEESGFSYCDTDPASKADASGCGTCLTALITKLKGSGVKIDPGTMADFLKCFKECKGNPACILKCVVKYFGKGAIDAVLAYSCCVTYSLNGFADPCSPGRSFDQDRCCAVDWCACRMRSVIDHYGGLPDKLICFDILCEGETNGIPGCDYWKYHK